MHVYVMRVCTLLRVCGLLAITAPLYGHAEGDAEEEDSLAVEVETTRLSPPRRRWKAHMHTLWRFSALAVRACLAAIGRPSGLLGTTLCPCEALRGTCGW